MDPLQEVEWATERETREAERGSSRTGSCALAGRWKPPPPSPRAAWWDDADSDSE